MGTIKNPKILFIEDEPEVVEMVKEYFNLRAVDVLSADESTVALLKIRKQKFDLIICDIHLKRGMGDYVIEQVRKLPDGDESNKNTPIVVMSSHLDVPLVKKLRTLVQGAIVKPCCPEDLFSKVEKFIFSSKNKKIK